MRNAVKVVAVTLQLNACRSAVPGRVTASGTGIAQRVLADCRPPGQSGLLGTQKLEHHQQGLTAFQQVPLRGPPTALEPRLAGVQPQRLHIPVLTPPCSRMQEPHLGVCSATSRSLLPLLVTLRLSLPRCSRYLVQPCLSGPLRCTQHLVKT